MPKKEKRSLFSRVFGSNNNTTAPQNATEFHILNGYQSQFTNYDGKFYDDADIRACVDAIARNGAKLSPKHIRTNDKGFENVNGNLQRILSKRPNEIQNAYKFYYYVINELELYNNSVVYIMRDENYKVTGLYPIHYQSIKWFEYKNEVYLEFSFGNSKKRFVPLKDCIHLTRFASGDGLMGGNNTPIIKVLSIKHVIDEGIVNAIKTTQAIRGVFKTIKAMLKPSDVKAMRDQFVKDFIEDADGSGIGGLDATSDFTPVKLEPKTADEAQIKSIDNKLMSYYGVNEAIIQSKYTEDEWNAFYESILEPIGLQMSLEFSNKLFTSTEIYHGNEIVFTSNRLQYASNNTKINLMRYANNLMMIDELREVLNLEPLPNGEGQKVMQDLNHINSNIADKYQTGEDSDNSEDIDGNENANDNSNTDNKKDKETKKMKNKEIRCLNLDLEMRTLESATNELIIEGYPVVFNSPATHGYTEIISERAFDNTDMTDVVLRYNHNDSFICLARTRNKSLELNKDEKGLKMKATLNPNIPEHKSIYEGIKSGLLDKMSFAFTTRGEEWDYETDTRTIIDIDKLYDVAVVDQPFYDSTSIYTRSLNETEKRFREEKAKNEENTKRKLELEEAKKELIKKIG